jgi:hypothetical protein
MCKEVDHKIEQGKVDIAHRMVRIYFNDYKAKSNVIGNEQGKLLLESEEKAKSGKST